MTIEANELGIFRAQRNSDASNNGGRVSLTQIASGVRNGIFPDLESGGTLAGNISIRKVFIKQNLNAVENSSYNNAFVYLKDIGDEDVFIDLAYGTETDTQAGVTFGSIFTGRVTAVDTQANQLTISTNVKPAAPVTTSIIRWRQTGDSMLQVDNATITASTGTSATITNISASDFAVGDIITQRVLFTAQDATDPNNLAPRVYGATAVGGTLDGTAVTLAPRAAIAFTINMTFLNSQSFNYSIPALGLSGTGSIADDLVIIHPEASSQSAENRMLTIPASAWGGTFANGNTASLSVISGNIPLWLRRTIGSNPSISGQQNVNFTLDYQTS